MPYTTQTAPVRNVLPLAALRLWVKVFNRVAKEQDEDSARMAAWHVVKEKGYRKGKDGMWTKVAGNIEIVLSDGSVVEIEDDDAEVSGLTVEAGSFKIIDATDVLEKAAAMALPKATLTKVYAEFRYFQFDIPNANKDGFLAGDVSDEAVATLIGSPIYVERDASDHPERGERATKRAKYQIGTIIAAEKKEDGVYGIGAFQREYLQDIGIQPEKLDDDYSVSMEVTFSRTDAKYKVGEKLMPYPEAVTAGAASPQGIPDVSENYDARYLVPMDFHGMALLKRGRNADKAADLLQVAASESLVEWHEADFAVYLKTTAVLEK